MDFKSNIILDYNIKKGNIAQKGQFSDPFHLQTILHNSLNYDSFEANLTRTVMVKKNDKDTKHSVIDKQNMNIIVMDNLTYPNQVRELLLQKYNNTFDFDELKLPASSPVYFGGVLEKEELGPINPNTGDRTTYTRRYVQCRTLTENDIVVDKNLHQILPVKVDLVPAKLVEFLDKRINIH